MKISQAGARYVRCIDNTDYPASLVMRGIYQLKPDPEARKRGLLRVVDESGDGYLYPKRLFVPFEQPKVKERLLRLRFGV